MKKPLKTLFYGLTHEHACGKFETLKRLRDDFEIVALVDDRPRGTTHFLDERIDVEKAIHDGFRIISEDEARALEGIDIVFVETANADLMEVAGFFARRGIPLHCDKPCGEALEPYRSIVEECRTRNLPFQIGYMYRGNPALRFIADFVGKGGLGDVTFVEADMNHDYQHTGYAEYISSFRGGILYNLGCHLVDMVLPLVGERLVSATTFIGDAPGDPAGSRTSGAALLSFERTKALIRTSSRMPGGILCRRLRMDGSNGTIDLGPIERFDGGELKLQMTLKAAAAGCASGTREISFGVQTDRYAAQLLDLAAVVRGEKANDQDYDRDLAVHEATLRACGIYKGDQT